MKKSKRFDFWVVMLVATVLFWPSTVRFVTGGAGSSLKGMGVFQRDVDNFNADGPSGSVELSKSSSGKQTFRVDLRDLAGESFGLFFGTNRSFDSNTIFFIGSLDLKTNDRWSIEYQNTGAAPLQLPVADLEDMEGLFLFISNPAGETNITGCVTNITDCDVEIVDDITNLVNCVTNVDNCVTSPVVKSVLVAEVPVLTNNGSAFSTKGKTLLSLPSGPPSPKAKGMISTKFNGKTGASLLDLRVSGLNGGQVYTLLFSTTPGGSTFTNVSITLEQVGGTLGFRRDTRLGQTLPMLASTVTNLSGLNIEIRDAFDDVHLAGTIP